ncbi:hypothetical protein ACQJBY_039296 [Aegilops geniculata]
MGVGSRNKCSSGSVFVSCVVLCLALLVVGATAKKSIRQCIAECTGSSNPKGCLTYCIREAVVVAAHEEARGVGGEGIGLLVTPVERAGQEEEEEKMKEEAAADDHLTFDPCDMCHPQDYWYEMCMRVCS